MIFHLGKAIGIRDIGSDNTKVLRTGYIVSLQI